MSEQSKLVSIKEASRLLGVTPLTLRNWDKKGKLSALRHPLNNYRVYRRDDIEKLISEIIEQTAPVQKSSASESMPVSKKSLKKLMVKHLV